MQSAKWTHATNIDRHSPLFATCLRSQHNRVIGACARRAVPASSDVSWTKVAGNSDTGLLCDDTQITKLPVWMARDRLAVASDELDAAPFDTAARSTRERRSVSFEFSIESSCPKALAERNACLLQSSSRDSRLLKKRVGGVGTPFAHLVVSLRVSDDRA